MKEYEIFIGMKVSFIVYLDFLFNNLFHIYYANMYLHIDAHI